MMGHNEPMKGGDEVDAFSIKCRKIMKFRAGAKRAAKKAFAKRIRRKYKIQIVKVDSQE